MAFLEVFRPLMRELHDHARRELIIAQLEADIGPGQLTVSDLIDELLVRVWEGWDLRPSDQPLDRWLIGLLHEILDERGVERPTLRRSPKRRRGADRFQSLFERLREDDPRYEAENGWAIENNPFRPEVEPLTLDEIIPVEETPEPWQELAAEERRRLVLSQLSSFPRLQRRAFTLHVLEGWDPEDIARVQRRSVEKVRADIEAVRQALRSQLANVSD